MLKIKLHVIANFICKHECEVKIILRTVNPFNNKVNVRIFLHVLNIIKKLASY